MSIRNNEERTGAKNPHTSGEAPPDLKSQLQSALDFVTPTEMVDLPSKGLSYPNGHPLHEKESIEIRFMTAKDEDILTSKSLLKKGVALNKLIDNLVVDKTINSLDLLIGDRNAIIIAARASAYGHIYETSVGCPACGEKSDESFDLSSPDISYGGETEDYTAERQPTGNYLIELPYSKIIVEVKLLRGREEMHIIKKMQNKKKNQPETLITDQMKSFIVSVNGDSTPKTINYLVNNMIVQESRYLREAFKSISPDLRIYNDFECPSCGHEQELEVPLGADFFWPNR